jgi:hypothetical protein
VRTLRPRAVTTIGRWTLGVLLVSWRYLWATTPLYRSTVGGDVSDCPPRLPEPLLDARSQPLAHGVGPLSHRLFAVDIDRAQLSADQLIAEITADLNRAVPSEVTSVDPLSAESEGLLVGQELVVRMPGPWDGPVRVVHRDSTSFRLATLAAHMEAGQIEFRAQGSQECLRFEIEAWARPGNRVVHLLHTHLWLASEIQVNMWVRFCLSAAEMAGGRPREGVTIRTRVIDDAPVLASCAAREHSRASSTTSGGAVR